MKKNITQLTENDLHRIVNRAVKSVLKESFEEGKTMEDLIMDLYKLGAELNLNKDARNWSIKGIGSIIMETCKRMMDLYKRSDNKALFSNVFNTKAKDLGQLK